MLFSSSVFLFAFLPLVLAVYYLPLRGHRRAQNIFLLAASLFFYAWGEPWFVLVMAVSILINYVLGLWVHTWKRQCRRLTGPVAAAAVCNLGLLFVFKYLTFTLETLSLVLPHILVPVIRLPIGISFFTFQAMSYVFDVALGKAEVQRDPLDLGLYIALFPQLIAGPIVKYSTVAQEIRHRRETWDDFSAGCCRFIVGLGKKVLLSNQLAVVADAAWNTVDGPLSASFAWLGSLCYILQLYYDFGGYSDMAIGLGRMFGFHFLENFKYPFAARSQTQFWQRWHISLGSWFRDYLYIPLGGSRVGRRKVIRNLFLVWLFTGIWHGANWTYLCWGLICFALLYLEKFQGMGEHWPWVFRWFFTLLCFDLSCVVFRAPSLAQAGQYLAAMFWSTPSAFSAGLEGYYWTQYWPILLLAVLFSFPVAPWLTRKVNAYLDRYARHIFPMWEAVYALAMALVFLASASFLVKGTYNPFIYFNF